MSSNIWASGCHRVESCYRLVDEHALVSSVRCDCFVQVAEEMAKQPQSHQQLYSKLMGSVTNTLISSRSNKPEKTMAMRTAGALAKATHAIYGVQVSSCCWLDSEYPHVLSDQPQPAWAS